MFNDDDCTVAEEDSLYEIGFQGETFREEFKDGGEQCPRHSFFQRYADAGQSVCLTPYFQPKYQKHDELMRNVSPYHSQYFENQWHLRVSPAEANME